VLEVSPECKNVSFLYILSRLKAGWIQVLHKLFCDNNLRISYKELRREQNWFISKSVGFLYSSASFFD